jgi:hypothetical protein
LLALLAAMISWFFLKLILVPDDPVIIQLGSDRPLTGSIHYDTLTPWARTQSQILSPDLVTAENGQPREVAVTIEPLGQANPKGRGSEVWIYEIASETERFDSEKWGSLPLPSSWQHNEKQRAVVFTRGERTPLTLNLRAKGKISLRLLRHPWSGQARITIDAISRIVDLYADESRSGPTQEHFLLPLPLEVPQRIETALPRTTGNFRLVLTDGPRIVRINRAEWQSRGSWVWNPKHGTAEVGSGVQILERDEDGWLLQMEQAEGWIAFKHLQVQPFFLPGSWGLIVILILVFIWWAAWETYRPSTRVGALLRQQMYWVKYALPCLVVWLVYWLAFFPGLMSPDSIHQWKQLLQFQFDDWHPASHTLVIWLITRIWLSPAAMALAQILALSGLIGWGLAKFARLGVPSAVLWVICMLFALSPVNGMMINALWKDIPYAISVLWLTLLMLKIIVSRGQWLAERWVNILVLAIALVFVAFFRHQGILVALGVVAILGVIYRSHWKQVLLAFILAAGFLGIVRGPLYELLNVKRLSSMQRVLHVNAIPLHQVAAAIAAGTPLTAEERLMLDKILPMEKWRALYRCDLVNPLIYNNPDINEEALWQHRGEFRDIWISLVLRNPGAVLKHQLCVGSLVWGVPPIYIHTVPRNIDPNDLGLSTQSQWPAMNRFLTGLVNWTEKRNAIQGLVWLSALYLYVTLLLTILVAFRTKNPNWLMFACPALVQSACLFLINVAQDFRYQYSVYLIGLISLCLLFFIIKPPQEVVKGSNTEGER